jgi:hypothetical protein
MTVSNPPTPVADPAADSQGKPLSPAAERALAEAAARRARSTPPEQSKASKGGPDPVRYGDWENRGLATDF